MAEIRKEHLETARDLWGLNVPYTYEGFLRAIARALAEEYARGQSELAKGARGLVAELRKEQFAAEDKWSKGQSLLQLAHTQERADACREHADQLEALLPKEGQ